MTQDELLMWVEAHGCKITHKKKKFYRVVNSEGQAMGIPSPRDGKDDLLPMTICRICITLKIPMPDCAQDAFKAYAEIQKNHHNKEL